MFSEPVCWYSFSFKNFRVRSEIKTNLFSPLCGKNACVTFLSIILLFYLVPWNHDFFPGKCRERRHPAGKSNGIYMELRKETERRLRMKSQKSISGSAARQCGRRTWITRNSFLCHPIRRCKEEERDTHLPCRTGVRRSRHPISDRYGIRNKVKSIFLRLHRL